MRRGACALILNLARRQLGPVSWANAFEALLEARGVKTGQGERNDQTSTSVVEVAKEAGVHPNTARNRLKLARELEPYPETAEKVDRRETRASARPARGGWGERAGPRLFYPPAGRSRTTIPAFTQACEVCA